MDVEFTVDVIREQATGGPRAENDEYLMSSGIGNALTDALQLATRQLANCSRPNTSSHQTKPPSCWVRQCDTTLPKSSTRWFTSWPRFVRVRWLS
jgi:hypothetical protein